MQYITHNINFTIQNGSIEQFKSKFEEKLIEYLVGTIGMTIVGDNSDTSGTTTDRKITLQYKTYTPYICIHISSITSTYGSNINFKMCSGKFDGSFQSGSNIQIIDINTTFTLDFNIVILQSDNFFCITPDIDKIKNIGNYGVIFCKAKNLSTGESIDSFAGVNCKYFFTTDDGNVTKLIQHVGTEDFESVGYARVNVINTSFVSNRFILLPAFLTENHNNTMHCKDWYIDELFVSFTTEFITGRRYRIDNKIYLAITPRCLVEITTA